MAAGSDELSLFVKFSTGFLRLFEIFILPMLSLSVILPMFDIELKNAMEPFSGRPLFFVRDGSNMFIACS